MRSCWADDCAIAADEARRKAAVNTEAMARKTKLARSMREEGHTCAEIAERTGLAVKTVRKLTRGLGRGQ